MIKKKVITGLLLVLMVGTLCGCGGKDKEETKEPTTQKQETSTDGVSLKVDEKYKKDEKVTLSSTNDSMDIYMPKELKNGDDAVIVYPFVTGDQEVNEISGKDYNIIPSETKLDAILARLANGDAIYYYFCEDGNTDSILTTINPEGTVIDIEHKGLPIKYTGVAMDDTFTCYIVFDLSDKTSGMLIVETDHELTDAEVTDYIDRINYN